MNPAVKCFFIYLLKYSLRKACIHIHFKSRSETLIVFPLTAVTCQYLFHAKVSTGQSYRLNELISLNQMISQMLKLSHFLQFCFCVICVFMYVYVQCSMCVIDVYVRDKLDYVCKLDMTHQVFHQCHLINPTTLKCILCVSMSVSACV